MEDILLYHTGFQEIREPDLRIGRRNADFGQGFYLSADREFSRRWARERRGETTWLNSYALSPEGLRIKRFDRDEAWYDYIFRNRAGYDDGLAEWDVIVGPIANDTIYDTWGISTSGLLSREQSLQLLMLGPVYEQTVIKTPRAAEQLRFLCAEVIPGEAIAQFRETVRREEDAYQRQVAEVFQAILGEKSE